MKLLLFLSLIAIGVLFYFFKGTPSVSNQTLENYLSNLDQISNTEEKSDPKEHFYKLFKDIKIGATESIIRDTYAEEFYFNDTFKTFSHVDELVPYLIHTAEQVEKTTVEILDVAKSESDYYIRWVMHMKFTAKGSNIDSLSTGVSQIRFDQNGKIVFHHDYWDSADGIYQHLPAVGLLVRKTKSML